MIVKISRIVFCIAILIVPVQTRPCACCAYEGQWSVYTQQFPGEGEQYAWFVGELSRLRLAGTLRAPEHGKGSEFFHKVYAVELDFDGRNWTILASVSGSGRFKPILRFTHPEEYEEFKTDHGARDGTFVDLYKEWRFTGVLEPLSDEVPVAAEQSALLILQGHGNNCINADDFEHWVLNFEIEHGGTRELAVAYGTAKTGK